MAVGKRMARQLLELARRVRLRDVKSPDGSGARDSRRAHFEAEYVHGPDAPHLRKLVGVLLSICSWMGPNARTGHELQGHQLNLAKLGRYWQLSPDEIMRYLVVLQDAGVLRHWQPRTYRDPRTGQVVRHGCPTGPSGHAYSLYHLVGGLPEELENQLKRYHYSWWPRRRDELTPSAAAAKEAMETYAELEADEAAMRFVRGLGSEAT